MVMLTTNSTRTVRGDSRPKYRLSGISTEAYRCFSRSQTVELRPLTLFYGRNNAGKSALLRLFPTIADSVEDGATSPLDLRRTAGPDVGFLDALNREAELKRIGLTLDWVAEDRGIVRDSFELRYVDEASRVIVDEVVVRDGEDRAQLRLKAQPFSGESSYTLSVAQGAEKDIAVDFCGLVPDVHEDVPPLQELKHRLLGLRHRIHWLQSFRTRLPRLVSNTGSNIRALQPDGQDAAQAILTNDQVRQAVTAWYARPEVGRRLEIKEVGNRIYRIFLNPENGPLDNIDLLDTGEGMVQVLPVLVAVALAQTQGKGAILALEEPESHLHGDAQQALAFHLASIAGSPTPPTIIAETHSRLLLLGIQLAIAKGRLQPEHCCLYWVDQETSGESALTKVELDRHGRPTGGWPTTAFEEDQLLARQLLDQQLQGGAFD